MFVCMSRGVCVRKRKSVMPEIIPLPYLSREEEVVANSERTEIHAFFYFLFFYLSSWEGTSTRADIHYSHFLFQDHVLSNILRC